MGSNSSSRLINLWRTFSVKKVNLGPRKKLENPPVDSKKECDADIKESRNMWRKLSAILRSGSIRRRMGRKVDEIMQIEGRHFLLLSMQ